MKIALIGVPMDLGANRGRDMGPSPAVRGEKALAAGTLHDGPSASLVAWLSQRPR